MTNLRTNHRSDESVDSSRDPIGLDLNVPTFDEGARSPKVAATLPDAWIERRSGAPSPREYGRKNVVAYLRSSTDDQLTSVPAQLSEVEPYVTRIGGKLVHTSIDQGRTGTTTYGRTALEEALTLIETGEADIFLVFRASRAAREPGDLLTIFSRVEDAECEFHTVDRGRMSDAEALFEAAYSKFEIKRMRAQLAAGVKNCIMEGRVPHGPSYGFVRHAAKPGHHKIHEERAAHICKAFHDRAHGTPVSVIANELHDARVPMPEESRKIDYEELLPEEAECLWDSQAVLRLFRKPIYMGIITWGKTKAVRDPKTKEIKKVKRQPKEKWISFYNPALQIVDPMVWHRVNALIVGNLKNSENRPESFPHFLFTGRIFCAAPSLVKTGCACGGEYHVAGSFESRRMKCQRAKNYENVCSVTWSLEYAMVERMVLTALGQELITAESADVYGEIFRKARAERQNEREAQRRELNRQIALDQALLDASFDAIVMSSFDPEEAAHQRQRATDRKNAARRDLEALDKAEKASALDFSRLDDLRKGWDDIVANGIDASTSEGAKLIYAIRLLVPRIEILPPNGADEVHGTIIFDFGRLLGDKMGTMGLSSIPFMYNAKDRAGRTVEEIKAARRERREKEAQEGRFDLTDAQWQIVEPLMAELGFHPVGGPRNLLCGMMYLVKTETHYTKMPSRWGTAKKFKQDLGNFSRCGLLDKVIAELAAKAPEAVIGFDLGRVTRERFKYNPGKAEKPKFSIMEVDFLAHAEGKSASIKKRCVALHRVSLGHSPDDIAKDLGMSNSWVLTHLNRFEHYGLEAILSERNWTVASQSCRLRPEDEEILVTKIRDGSNPYGEPAWNRKMIIRYALEEHEIVWTEAFLGRWLKKRNLSLQDIALDLSFKRAGLQRFPAGAPTSQDGKAP